MKFKWYYYAVGTMLLLGGLLSWSFTRSTPRDERGIPRSFSRIGSQGFATPGELEQLLYRDPSHRANLEAYRTHAQYPDFSRPLEKSMVDLTDPWKHVDEPLPLIDDSSLRTENGVKKRIEDWKKAGRKDEDIEAELKNYYESRPRYQFSANRHTLTFGDELIVLLKVTDSRGAIIPYAIGETHILGDPQFSRSRLGAPEFNDAGFAPDATANDSITTFNWKIPGQDKKYWGNLKLVVQIKVKGSKEPVEVAHSFFSSPISPANFTDNFSERIENGSLVIDNVIEVKRECKFVFQANLYDAQGKPTHWVTVNTVLEPGFRTVSFLFYGKIFHDSWHEGRFTMRDLRGTCENLPFPAHWMSDPSKTLAIATAPPLEEPLLYYMPFTPMTFTTNKEYKRKDFTSAEWSSPEKDARMRELEELARLEGR